MPKKMLDWLSVVIPFLDPYPVWVKASVAAWLVFSAVILVMLLFFRAAPESRQAAAPPAGQNPASTTPAEDRRTDEGSAKHPDSADKPSRKRQQSEPSGSDSGQQQATIKDSSNATVYQAGRDLVIVPPAPTSPNAPSLTIQSIVLEVRLTCTTRSGVELPPEKVDLLAWFGGDATLRGPAGDATLKLVSPVYFQRLTDSRLVVINRFVLQEDSQLRFRPTQVLGTYNELLLPVTTVVNTYSDAIDRVQLLELSFRINGGDPDYQSYRYDVEFVRGKGMTFTVPLRKTGG